MIMQDLHTNKYKRKRVNITNAFGLIFGLIVVGAYFGLMLYILCFIHNTPVTYP